MFFTPELLSQRDSGLAATLGAKSSFKKLPKRSVLTADISQLCDLIAEPEEALALRLSSNLMVGVARVYKVKHEIFLADVTTCFNSLKKAITEINMASSAQLQMGQPSARPEALTLDVDPANALAATFANMFMDWDENATGAPKEVDEDEYDPTNNKKSKQKKKQKAVVPSSENPRANAHTLNEDLSHLLSGSFDTSFSNDRSGGLADPFSSQVGDIFGFEDNLLGAPHDLDLSIGDIGDELARELGEGWGATDFLSPVGMGEPMQFGGDDLGLDFDMGGGEFAPATLRPEDPQSDNESRSSRKRPLSDSDKENHIIVGNLMLQSRRPSSVPPELIPNDSPEKKVVKKLRKKGKVGGLVVDDVTELSNEELKDSRSQYMERQNLLRFELDARKRERENIELIDQMMWAVPHDILAPEIIDFWRENLRAQMAGRVMIVDETNQPPKKRRKTQPRAQKLTPEPEQDMPGGDYQQVVDMDMRGDFENDYGLNDAMAAARLRSSEEPGQGRNGPRPPSMIGSHLDLRLRGLEDSAVGSQKSALFPWDNAGVSSSAGLGFDFEDGTPAGSTDVRIRRRSSQAQSPSLRERGSSVLKSLAASPAQFSARHSRLSVDDFEFELPAEESLVETQPETQPENSLLTLEKNSFNFLEYARMQFQTLPAAKALTFEDVVPRVTSTRHVAAAAFYHCLVLATKDLLNLRQEHPYNNVELSIK